MSRARRKSDTGLDLALELACSRRLAIVQEMARRGVLTDPQTHEFDLESRQLLGAFNAMDGLIDELVAAIRPAGSVLH